MKALEAIRILLHVAEAIEGSKTGVRPAMLAIRNYEIFLIRNRRKGISRVARIASLTPVASQLFAFPRDMYLCLILSSLGSRGRPGIGSKSRQTSFKSAVKSILLDKALMKIQAQTMVADI